MTSMNDFLNNPKMRIESFFIQRECALRSPAFVLIE